MSRFTADEEYNVKPGRCLIINNMEFSSPKLAPLPGDKDEHSLKLLFTALNFEVDIRRNLTANQMEEAAQEYGRMEHTGVFVFVVLSHGGPKDEVYSSDSETVPVLTLEEYFTAHKCQSLANIPKIFIIDACRGDKKEGDHDDKGANQMNQHSYQLYETQGLADFALVFACSPNYVAYCHNEFGSDLTQNLKVAIDEADEDDHLQIILNRVKQKCKQQCVTVVDSLKKKYYIKRDTPICNMQKCYKEFKEEVQKWLTIRQTTIEIIEGIIKYLIEQRRNVNFARITGGITAAGGGAMALVGLALIPVTFGGSMALMVGGVALSTVGGVTATGAGIADIPIQLRGIEDAKEHYEREQRKLEKVMNLSRKIEQFMDETTQQCRNVDANLIKEFLMGTIHLDKSQVAAGMALKFLIPINLVQMVRAAVNMKKGNETSAVKKLREFQENLKSQKKKIEDTYHLKND